MELEGAARASARRGKNKEKSLFLKKKKSQDDLTRKKEIKKERLACLGGWGEQKIPRFPAEDNSSLGQKDKE